MKSIDKIDIFDVWGEIESITNTPEFESCEKFWNSPQAPKDFIILDGMHPSEFIEWMHTIQPDEDYYYYEMKYPLSDWNAEFINILRELVELGEPNQAQIREGLCVLP